MSKENTSASEDIYGVYKQNVDKYFENMEKSLSKYFESLENVQEEYCKSCKNTINTVLSLQQDLAKKSGTSFDIPDTVKKAIVDTNKQLIKANSVQNQIIQASIDSMKQNMKAWNDNADSFADMNKNILQMWTSTFMSKP